MAAPTVLDSARSGPAKQLQRGLACSLAGRSPAAPLSAHLESVTGQFAFCIKKASQEKEGTVAGNHGSDAPGHRSQVAGKGTRSRRPRPRDAGPTCSASRPGRGPVPSGDPTPPPWQHRPYQESRRQFLGADLRRPHGGRRPVPSAAPSIGGPQHRWRELSDADPPGSGGGHPRGVDPMTQSPSRAAGVTIACPVSGVPSSLRAKGSSAGSACTASAYPRRQGARLPEPLPPPGEGEH